MKQKIQLAAGILSLAALLTYTLIHTGGLLARYIAPAFIGYVAAFGIEASIVSLSLRIGELRKTKQDAKFFYFVLLSVLLVSAIANISEGFHTYTGQLLSVQTAVQLDPVQAIIAFVATGLISLIVLALSEIVGNDVEATVKAAQRQSRQTTPKPVQNIVLDTVNDQKRMGKERAMDQLLAHIGQNPTASLTEIGTAIGRSKSTAGNYLDELANAGRVQRNGNGWEVLN